ncbi:putative transmembrane protein [Toxoplasma gondii RUB]|uniref:Putative transmembrane protein n=1 Tax=Toxoplasma gondii RUB TaxID=935652 RepID=A0A086M6Z9_TOXGO|nr:putative transmembrane protein [Toxoplasma gondii RUB]
MVDRILRTHWRPLRVSPSRPSMARDGKNIDAGSPEGRPAADSTALTPWCAGDCFPPFPDDILGWLRFANSSQLHSHLYQMCLLRLAFLCQTLLVLGLTYCSVQVSKGVLLLFLFTVLIWFAVEGGLHLTQSAFSWGGTGRRRRQHVKDVSIQPCMTLALLCELITPQVAVWVLDLPAKTVLTTRLLSSSICRILSFCARLSPADLFVVSSVDVGLSIGAVTSLRRWANNSEDVALVAAASAALLFSGLTTGLSSPGTPGRTTGSVFPFSGVLSRWTEEDSQQENPRCNENIPEHHGHAAKTGVAGPGYRSVFYLEERKRVPHVVSQDEKNQNFQAENRFPVTPVGQSGAGSGHPFFTRVGFGADSEMSSHTTTTLFASHPRVLAPMLQPSMLTPSGLLSGHLDPCPSHSTASPGGTGNNNVSRVGHWPLRKKAVASLHNVEFYETPSCPSSCLTGPVQKHPIWDLWSSTYHVNTHEAEPRSATDVAGLVLRASDILILSSLERCRHTIQMLTTHSVPKFQESGGDSVSEVDCRLLNEVVLVECHHVVDELELIHKNLVGILRLLGRCSPGCFVSSATVSNYPSTDEVNPPISKQPNSDLWERCHGGCPSKSSRRAVGNIQATCPACGSSDLLQCVCIAIDQPRPFELYHCMDLLKRGAAVVAQATSVKVRVAIADDVDSLTSVRYGDCFGVPKTEAVNIRDELGHAQRLTVELHSYQGRMRQSGEFPEDPIAGGVTRGTVTHGVSERAASSCEGDLNDLCRNVRNMGRQKELWLEGHEKELLVVLQSLIAAVSAAASPGDEVTLSVRVDTETSPGCLEHADFCSADPATGFRHLETDRGDEDALPCESEFDSSKGRATRSTSPFFVTWEQQMESAWHAFCFEVTLLTSKGISLEKPGVSAEAEIDMHQMTPHLLAAFIQECLDLPRCVYAPHSYERDNYSSTQQVPRAGIRGYRGATTNDGTCRGVQHGVDSMLGAEHEHSGRRSERMMVDELESTRASCNGVARCPVTGGRSQSPSDGWAADKPAVPHEKLNALSSVLRFCQAVIERRFGGRLGTSRVNTSADFQKTRIPREIARDTVNKTVEERRSESYSQELTNLLARRRESTGEASSRADKGLRLAQVPSQDGFSVFFTLPLRRCPLPPGAANTCDRLRFVETGYGKIPGHEASLAGGDHRRHADVGVTPICAGSPGRGHLCQPRRSGTEKHMQFSEAGVTHQPGSRSDGNTEMRSLSSGARIGNSAGLWSLDDSPATARSLSVPQASGCRAAAHPTVFPEKRNAAHSLHTAETVERIGCKMKTRSLTRDTRRQQGSGGPLEELEGKEHNVQQAVRDHGPVRQLLKKREQKTFEDGEANNRFRSGLLRGNEEGEFPGRGPAEGNTPTGSTWNTSKCTATRECLLDFALRHTSKKRPKYGCLQDSDKTSSSIDEFPTRSRVLLPFGDVPSLIPFVSSEPALVAEMKPKEDAGNNINVQSTQTPVSCHRPQRDWPPNAASLSSHQTATKCQVLNPDTPTVDVSIPWGVPGTYGVLKASSRTSDRSTEECTRNGEGKGSSDARVDAGKPTGCASGSHACLQMRDVKHIRNDQGEGTLHTPSVACWVCKMSPKARERALRHNHFPLFSSSADESAFSAAADALFDESVRIDQEHKHNAKLLSPDSAVSENRVEGLSRQSKGPSMLGGALSHSVAEKREMTKNEQQREENVGGRKNAHIDRETSIRFRVVQPVLSGELNTTNTVGLTGPPSPRRTSGSGHCTSARRKSSNSLDIPLCSPMVTGKPRMGILGEEREPWCFPAGSHRDLRPCSEAAFAFQSAVDPLDSNYESEEACELRQPGKGLRQHGRTYQMEKRGEGDQKKRESEKVVETGLERQSNAQKQLDPVPQTEETAATSDSPAGIDAIRIGLQQCLDLQRKKHGVSTSANPTHRLVGHTLPAQGTEAFLDGTLSDQSVNRRTEEQQTPGNSFSYVPLLEHANAKSNSLHDEPLAGGVETLRSGSSGDRPATDHAPLYGTVRSLLSSDRGKQTTSRRGEGYEEEVSTHRERIKMNMQSAATARGQQERRHSCPTEPLLGPACTHMDHASSLQVIQDESAGDCGSRDGFAGILLMPLSSHVYAIPSRIALKRQGETGEKGTLWVDSQEQGDARLRDNDGADGNKEAIRFRTIHSSTRTPPPCPVQRVAPNEAEERKETATHSVFIDTIEGLGEEDQQERRWIQLQQEEQQLRMQLKRTTGLLESLAARRKKTYHTVPAADNERPPTVPSFVKTAHVESNANMGGSNQDGRTRGGKNDALQSEDTCQKEHEAPFILTRSLDAEGHDKVVLAASRGWSPSCLSAGKILSSSSPREAPLSSSNNEAFAWNRARYQGFSGAEEELFPSARAEIPGGKTFTSPPVVWGRQGAIGANGTPMIVPRKLRETTYENDQCRTNDACGFARGKPQTWLSIYGTPLTAVRTVTSGSQGSEKRQSGTLMSTLQRKDRDSGGCEQVGLKNRKGCSLGFSTAHIPMGFHGTPMTEPRIVRPRGSPEHSNENGRRQ